MSGKRSPRRRSRKPSPGLLSGLWSRQALGLLAIAAGVFALLSLPPLGGEGVVSQAGARLLQQAFGWTAYPFSAGLVVVGGLLFLRPPEWWKGKGSSLGGALISLGALAGLLHLLSSGEPLEVVQGGGGGGYLGWALSILLAKGLGRWGAFLVLSLVGLGGLLLLIPLSWAEMRKGAERGLWALRDLYGRRAALPKVERVEAPPVEKPPKPRREKVPMEQPAIQRELPLEEARPVKPRGREGHLPSLDLLEESPYPAASEADVEQKARIIEETLVSFGLPAKVVSIRQGPTVTQFGVEPGYVRERGERERRVRVSKIVALKKDLALALASSPIRIEAPVPGRSVIGIEVPNTELSPVALRGVMGSKAFQELALPLKIALGRDVSGQAVVADLGQMPHLLIAGATGSGKSVCISSILTCLLFQNPPSRLGLLLVDPKMVELIHFSGLPHLMRPVVREVDETILALRGVMKEMERRYRDFARAGARNIDHYNARQTGLGEKPLPYIVVAIDELADLMMAAPDEIERLICRLAQLSRATGIHLIIATQRPSVEVVTGLIKANFPARISFAVSSQVDSRVVLDAAGAETLLGRGDMLYMAPDSSSLLRLQGCFVSDKEIGRLIAFWQREAPPEEREEEVIPWEEVEEEEKHDSLLEEAIALVRQHERASASFLQRRLGIGYPRAARLMEQLEELGYVGPMERGGRSRKVLIEGEEEEVIG